jgi:hypothetical protein
MTKQTRLVGATLAAVAFSLFFVAGAFAAPPTYEISLVKTADPATLPSAGGDVDYWFAVHNDGTGDFQGVAVSDSDCTPTFDHSSDPADDDQGGGDKLNAGETWTFTCGPVHLTATHTNTAVAAACHDNSVEDCNNEDHYAESNESSATVTVGTSTSTIDDVSKTAGPVMLALILLAIGGLGFLGTTNRLPKLPRIG